MNIHIRFCRECGKGFDVGTNYDLCSECRIEGRLKDEGRGNFRRYAQ